MKTEKEEKISTGQLDEGNKAMGKWVDNEELLNPRLWTSWPVVSGST